MIPEMVIMCPKDESELRDMLYTAVRFKGGPVALRYPRGNGLGVTMREGFQELPIGKGETLRKGTSTALLAVGSMVDPALKAAALLEAKGITCEVVNMRFVKPLDEELLDDLASRFPSVVTLEENVIAGGFGSAVAEYYASRQHPVRVHRHGLPDRFVAHGSPEELQAELCLTPAGIASVVEKSLEAGRSGSASVPPLASIVP